ncbi:4458_t:CDS:2 [Acaulospora colombiana]|uniref:4458_t:CDS:1 n=1 Tax=Acaulospora colombiana TaxID=27376 RepID=A0ACA9KE71_9GLOM|nr:4458_t:CDS:2 [Acaulospora colombiana]
MEVNGWPSPTSTRIILAEIYHWKDIMNVITVRVSTTQLALMVTLWVLQWMEICVGDSNSVILAQLPSRKNLTTHEIRGYYE